MRIDIFSDVHGHLQELHQTLILFEKLNDEVLNAVPAQMIIMGHTHHPMCVEYNGRWLLNAGSIYGNRDREQRTCAVLELPEIKFTLYDIDTGDTLSI